MENAYLAKLAQLLAVSSIRLISTWLQPTHLLTSHSSYTICYTLQNNRQKTVKWYISGEHKDCCGCGSMGYGKTRFEPKGNCTISREVLPAGGRAGLMPTLPPDFDRAHTFQMRQK